MLEELNHQIIKSSKWSFATELLSKLTIPIINMVLARLLTPEVFGIIATINMIVAFAELFVDAGFQKYIVQHDFEDEADQINQVSVAFWTNIFMAILIWLIIYLFSEDIAMLLGNAGMGVLVSISCLSIPLNAIASIQMAVLRRSFKFKVLFKLRFLTLFVPILVTLPLAYFGFGYWSLIVGTLATNLLTIIALLIFSDNKILFYYDFAMLKKMFSFSMWSFIESISIWLTMWIDVFIIAAFLDQHYLGLYKNSMVAVNSCLAIITGATTPILFSALSRLQNDKEEYVKTFLKFQQLVALSVVPMGIGIFCYRDLAVEILFGAKWHEADLFVGLWGLSSSLMIIFGHYCSEVYRSKGMPKLSFWAQLFHLIVLVPVLYFTAQTGFSTLIWARTLVRAEAIIVHFVFMYYIIKISPFKMITNTSIFLLAGILMGTIAVYIRPLYDGIIWNLFTILICIGFYFGILMLIPKYRDLLITFYKKMFSK
ncbi:MAG: lipopolysaccharide biosynthesis protein [Acholeplasmataceae bacterium]|nr:lipopolysaccharide biosynthesis protein [Acholeplasmataceae bacterium]